MSKLGKYRKAELRELAEELRVDLLPSDKVIDIVQKIEGSENYSEDFALDCLVNIREENEKVLEREEAERVRAFELEKLRITHGGETRSETSENNTERRARECSMKNVMPKFDSETSDITLFLSLFERQAKKLQIRESDYVMQLLALLPTEMTQLIVRETEAENDDFEAVKKILLERYRLSTEAFRIKYMSHQRGANTLWKDLVFELRTYLESWLAGAEISDFEGLKDLMIADQVKRRASPELRQHFVDDWGELNNPREVAEKFDKFELARKVNKKTPIVKPPEKGYFKRTNSFGRSDKGREKPKVETSQRNWREKSDIEESRRTEVFERRKKPACYQCGSISHLRYNCPDLKKTEKVNKLEVMGEFHESFKPYLKTGKLDNQEICILRDSGTSFDLVSKKYITEEKLNGEYVWMRQPLENKFTCLAVANVDLEVEGVKLITKAAVLNPEVKMDHYLLGNRTQEIIDKLKRDPKTPEIINLMITRSKAKNNEESEKRKEEPETSDLAEHPRDLEENEGPLLLPCAERDEGLELLEVTVEEFGEEQRIDPSLKSYWEKAEAKKGAEYEIKNNLLFRMAVDKKMGKRKQLIIPEKFREKILALCHSSVSASHTGMNKLKDRLLRQFYWPNIIKDAEEFVKYCEPCQRVGNSRDQKRAPLKLVPIISEIFAKLSVDTVGPLPISENGNKYMLTVMCLASKYPDAIPLKDIKSESVIEALLNIFSRYGFPKIFQCDLGTCFTSNVTSTFLEKFGIKVCHSSVHHPQTNQVERFHRTVKRLLKILCVENGKDWEKNLPAALLALRTVTHEATGFSPAELVHGRNLRTPEMLLFEHWVEPEEEDILITEYMFELINRLKRCQELAAEKMSSEQKKRKTWYDQKAVTRNFKIGDQVLVLATHKPNKLAVNWVGPGVVESQISETNYVVRRLDRNDRSQIYHVNLLKPYYKKAESINLLMIEERDKESEENDLEIEFPGENGNEINLEDIIRTNELGDQVSPEKLDQLREVLQKHRAVFSNDPGKTDLIEHDIELISDKPIRCKPYRTSPRQTEILKNEIKKMLELGVIVKGQSDFTAPMILVESTGRDPRPCIDYRKLNSVTKTNYFPLPNIEERVEKVSAAKYISVLDLTKGYWQIPLSERAQRYTGFITSFGAYLCRTMPFGLIGAPYTFSKFMAELLEGLDDFCVPYLDDMAIFSSTWEDHLKHLDIVLTKIENAKLKIKPGKSKIAQKSVKYLGHIVGNGIRSPAETKIKAIVDFPTPRNKTEIRRFIGMVSYYGRYIKDFAKIAEPLTSALKGKIKKEKIEWTSERADAFEQLKGKLMEKPVLQSPIFSEPFLVQTDASSKGIGVVLSQKNAEGQEHPVLYLSRKFTKAEENYSATERECLAITFALKKLRNYLDGQSFTIETDHNPLVWLKTNMGNNPRLMRWALALQPFDYTVVHRPGKEIGHVDTLSRIN